MAWSGDPVDPPGEGKKLVFFLLQRKLCVASSSEVQRYLEVFIIQGA